MPERVEQGQREAREKLEDVAHARERVNETPAWKRARRLNGGYDLSLDENRARGNSNWPRVDALPSSVPGTKLWWCPLDATADEIVGWRTVLSDAERTRAARFGMPLLQTRYVVGRTALRTVLGSVLGVAPPDVPIERGVRGRPRLREHVGLDFNVSHTADVALIGISDTARIGVDVECRDRPINVTGIARKFLTETERADIAAMDADAARGAVLTLWTCKEAMSKATGDALSAPFAHIDVDCRDGRHLRSGPAPYRAGDWTLHAVAVPSDYIATLASWRA